jgi:hypothetical protein
VLEQEKRIRRREERIGGGVDDLELWLQDLVRDGLAEAAARPWASFEQMSERLVDAQAPGLARLVRDLGGLPHRITGWPERMLIDVGRLALLLEANRRLESLEPDLRAEVRTVLGIPERRDDVLATPPVHDTWDILGHRLIYGDRLTVQRTWLRGQQTQRWALILDFSVGREPPDQVLTPGASCAGNLCFYSGTARLRALFKEPPLPAAAAASSLPARTVQDVLRAYAESLGRNPWQERIPAALRGAVPHRTRGETWYLIDAERRHLPMAGSSGWHLMALSGGHPLDVFGEWDGYLFWPLSALAEGRIAPLRESAAA